MKPPWRAFFVTCPALPLKPVLKRRRGPTYHELAANAAHALIGVASSLLDSQIASLAAAFEVEGGFTERLYRIRSERRKNQQRPPRS